MPKDRDRISNRSYLFRLNEELSGQAELGPYSITSGIDTEQDAIAQSINDEIDPSEGNQDHSEQ